MRTLKASEIGEYLYCARAWWYHRQGIESENQASLTGGADFHQHHGRRVLVAGLLRLAGWLALLAAVLLLAISLGDLLLP